MHKAYIGNDRFLQMLSHVSITPRIYYVDRGLNESEGVDGKKRVGILTSDGDFPGLNSAIKGIVSTAEDEGYEIIGIWRGWEGLMHLNLGDYISKERHVVSLTAENTRKSS